MELTITFGEDHGSFPCFMGAYFEIRDGLNQSANLLSLFCKFRNKGYVFWSSGRHMWVKLHDSKKWDEAFYINYTAHGNNFTGIKSLLIFHRFFVVVVLRNTIPVFDVYNCEDIWLLRREPKQEQQITLVNTTIKLLFNRCNFLLLLLCYFCSVAPTLAQVKTTQVVLFKYTSFLWCPAEGAPAPAIVWRKNGMVVQNSTSVRFNLGIVKENNSTYSCEVKTSDKLTKKELTVLIESELFFFLNPLILATNTPVLRHSLMDLPRKIGRSTK